MDCCSVLPKCFIVLIFYFIFFFLIFLYSIIFFNFRFLQTIHKLRKLFFAQKKIFRKKCYRAILAYICKPYSTTSFRLLNSYRAFYDLVLEQSLTICKQNTFWMLSRYQSWYLIVFKIFVVHVVKYVVTFVTSNSKKYYVSEHVFNKCW